MRKVYEENKQYSTVGELEAAVIEAWDSIDPKLISSLISSMEKRIFEVILRKGSYTNY